MPTSPEPSQEGDSSYTGVAGLVRLMDRLRVECGWDAAQTHRSLVQYLVEECHELVEAIEDGAWERGDSSSLREELGDVLLQVVFHARVAQDRGDFTLEDVATVVSEKMVRRHPEVFGGAEKTYTTLAEREEQWQRAKQAEKKERSGPFDGIPTTMPALTLAEKMVDRAVKLNAGKLDSGDSLAVPSESAFASEEELGERLFSLVRQAHAAGLDPERALRTRLRQLRG